MASTSSRSYDVFLSFIGVDTHDSFTAHLYRQLCRNGINIFLDDEGLERGQVITPALVTAIENSKCRRTKGQRVIPIFYNIDPSDVRNQRGKFGETVVKHEKNLANRERVQIWRDALTEVANLSGWHLRNKNEAKLIEEIVRSILEGMDKTPIKSIDDGMAQKIRSVQRMRDLILRTLTQWASDRHDNAIARDLMSIASVIRAFIRSYSPNDIAIVTELIQLVGAIRDSIEIIGPHDDAIVRALIQLANEMEALTQSVISKDKVS
ncbi:disease resistance protein RPV1-like [Vitis riparia]|uniref:disease resistance protein RPV1-like n=1 Tax=Vitis riparia TaxID=96939 RepID=UPI00155AA6A5|nr:disease resistance protein RPV1-like [Vitis riparia]